MLSFFRPKYRSTFCSIMIARSSNVGIKSRWTRMLRCAQNTPHLIYRRLVSLLASFIEWVVQVFTKFYDGTKRKEEKVIIKQSPFKALKRCSVHIPPICATAVLASINLRGYFVGIGLTGFSASAAQSIDRLLLQITAKLYVCIPIYLCVWRIK